MQRDKIAAVAFSVGALALAGYFWRKRQYQRAVEETIHTTEAKYGLGFATRAMALFGELSEGEDEITREHFVLHMEKAWKESCVDPKLSDEELAIDFSSLFDAYDSDKDGKINFIEFVHGLALLSNNTLEEKANFIFDSWDTKKDGVLTIDEIRNAYGKSLQGAWKVLDTQLAMALGYNHWNFSGLCFSFAQTLLSTVVHEEDVIEAHTKQLLTTLDDHETGRITREEWLRHASELPIFKYLEASELEQNAVSIAVRAHATLGEGPHWDPSSEILYYIDILGKKILAFSPKTGFNSITPIQSFPGCLAPITSIEDELIVATQEGLAFFNIKKKTSDLFMERIRIEDKPENRFNDGKVDPAGRLWVGSVAFNCQGQEGSLFCFEPDGTYTVKRKNVGISNGLCWSPDAKTMYFIDSPTKKVVAFDYDVSTGDISNERDVVVFDTEKDEVPDGMTIDSDGKLWIAIWGGCRVARYDPNTGECLKEIPIPAPNVTSCCFGGPQLDVLYVTSAACDTDLKKYPAAGCLFAVRNVGAKGLPMMSFNKVPRGSK